MSPSEMTEFYHRELAFGRQWAQTHVSDNCGYHYIRLILAHLVPCISAKEICGISSYGENEFLAHTGPVPQPTEPWRSRLVQRKYDGVRAAVQSSLGALRLDGDPLVLQELCTTIEQMARFPGFFQSLILIGLRPQSWFFKQAPFHSLTTPMLAFSRP